MATSAGVDCPLLFTLLDSLVIPVPAFDDPDDLLVLVVECGELLHQEVLQVLQVFLRECREPFVASCECGPVNALSEEFTNLRIYAFSYA